MKPTYTCTPLMAKVDDWLNRKGHPSAFAIANFGDGPMLTYRGRKSRVSILSVSLHCGNQHIELSQSSEPPYLIALVQEKPSHPILTVLYRTAPDPVLEQSMDHRLTGQVFAYGQSPDGSICNVAHALYLAERSQVFAASDRYNSLLLEGHPELCSHLRLCGEMIEVLLRQQKGNIYNV